jgi:hypothetical protein
MIYFYDDSYPYKGFVGDIDRFNSNKLFTWNKSEHDAFIQLKNAHTFENLQNFSESYVNLYKRISEQAPKEREYEQDVSFNSPLL